MNQMNSILMLAGAIVAGLLTYLFARFRVALWKRFVTALIAVVVSSFVAGEIFYPERKVHIWYICGFGVVAIAYLWWVAYKIEKIQKKNDYLEEVRRRNT